MALNGDKQIRRELLAERAPAAAAPAGRRITSVYLTHLMCLIEALTVGFTDQHFGPDQSRRQRQQQPPTCKWWMAAESTVIRAAEI